jgi:sugar lactone lactonase YvrE
LDHVIEDKKEISSNLPIGELLLSEPDTETIDYLSEVLLFSDGCHFDASEASLATRTNIACL